MRVALVNATNGGLSGGSVKYLHGVVPELARHKDVAELTVFVPPNSLSETDLGHPVHTWPAGDVARGFRELRAAISRIDPDVIFVPNARRIGDVRAPVVTMVRNMEPLVNPFGGNGLVEGVRNSLRLRAAKTASLRADSVIAVSEFVRRTICDRWRIPSDRVSVVYHGADPVRPLSARRPVRVPADCESFLFCAGVVRPYRGVEDALRALAELRSRGTKTTLVVAGTLDPRTARYHKWLSELARTLGVGESVKWLGNIGPDEMLWCYERARAFVMTSRVEACPNVALEAMFNGSRCVSTDVDPMPEFFGAGARYYRPGDHVALADHIAAMLASTPDEARAESDRMRAQAARYTWRDTAAQTAAVLAEAIADSRSRI